MSVLLLGCVAIGTVLRPSDNGDFWYFADRAGDLFGASGFRVYADFPKIQSGPITLLLSGAVDRLDPGGFVLVPMISALCCFVTLVAIASSRTVRRRSVVLLVVGGAVLIAWWWYLSLYGHLDDALVLTIGSWALLLVQRQRPLPAAVLLGLTLAIKPWAVFLVPLTLQPESGSWRSLKMPAVSILVGSIVWAPFLLASSGTLDGMRPPVQIAADSVIHLFTRQVGGDVPAVLRLAQLAGALGVVAWITWRRSPAGALLAGIAVRLAFDPATWEYYTVGLVVGALIWDLEISPRRWPMATIAATVLVPPDVWFELPELRSALRLFGCIVMLTLVFRAEHYSSERPEPMNACAPRPTSRTRRPGGADDRNGAVGDLVGSTTNR
jgi:hypothetical protein